MNSLDTDDLKVLAFLSFFCSFFLSFAHVETLVWFLILLPLPLYDGVHDKPGRWLVCQIGTVADRISGVDSAWRELRKSSNIIIEYHPKIISCLGDFGVSVFSVHKAIVSDVGAQRTCFLVHVRD